MTPSPRIISVSKLIRCTRCVPLNVTTFHFEEITIFVAISKIAIT